MAKDRTVSFPTGTLSPHSKGSSAKFDSSLPKFQGKTLVGHHQIPIVPKSSIFAQHYHRHAEFMSAKSYFLLEAEAFTSIHNVKKLLGSRLVCCWC
jgi:hypothetical protein